MPIPISINLVTGLLSFLMTIMVLSYLLGDNPFFRLAIHLFIGVSAGYAAAVTWYQVLWPKLFQPIIYGSLNERLLLMVPLLLGISLLVKLSPPLARLGNPAMAYLVGVGAAVAIGGAVFGTLFPQAIATVNLFDLRNSGSLAERLLEGSLILVGTLTTLVYFHFGAKATPAGLKRGKAVEVLGWIGQIFIAITFGALFAGAYAAAMTALIERLDSILKFILSLRNLF